MSVPTTSRALSINHDPQQAEEECLKALNGALSPPTGPYSVRAPKLYHFNPSTNTQVQEYLPSALSLKDFALKHFSSPSAPSDAVSRKPLCHELGHSLGAWLRSFHDWAARPEQTGLKDKMRANRPMQQLKHMVNYTTLVATVGNFPTILGDGKEVFEEVERAMAREMEKGEEKLEVIHGDFWTGK